jgi:hypothetical protein
MAKSDRDHYDRPSWKEIDRKKDGRGSSESRDHPAGPKEMHRNKVAKKEYLKQLDNFFKGDRGSADHFELLQLLKTYQSGKKFAENIAKYVELYGMPDDHEILAAMLELADAHLVSAAIEKVVADYPKIAPNLQELISMKVELLKLTHTDKAILHQLSKIPKRD